MTNTFNKLKDYLKGMKFDLSDYMLAIGFLLSVPFYAFAWKFMVTPNPAEIFLKPWMMIVLFSGTAICWGIYFYLEIKKGRLKNNVFLWAFVFLNILGLIAVVAQPETVRFLVECKKAGKITWSMYPGVKVGDIVEVVYTISPTHRLFFAFASLCITTIFFIIFTLLPRRMKDMNFLIFAAICTYGFLLVISIYSYIAEADHYIPFIKALFKGDSAGMYKYAVISLLTHRVPYGVCMMLGCMFAILCHTLTKKWYWIIPFIYCYINMIFTWCKTALLITPIVLVIYIVLLLIETFKEHKKRNTIIFAIGGGVIGLVLLLTLVSVLTKGKFLGPINSLVETFTKSDTIKTRSYIWGNIRLELANGWWLLGRGFGTHNSMLFPMNILNNDLVCPSHSTYYAVLGQGGIFTLIGFLAGYVYYGYVFVKCFKVNKHKTMQLSIPFLAYFMYSFTEGVNYLIAVFMFPLILYYFLVNNI